MVVKLLFKIRKSNEDDSCEHRKISNTLKSIYNLVAILNVVLIIYLVPNWIEFFLQEISSSESIFAFLKFNFLFVIWHGISLFLLFATTSKMFSETYLPSEIETYFYIIVFIFNSLSSIFLYTWFK